MYMYMYICTSLHVTRFKYQLGRDYGLFVRAAGVRTLGPLMNPHHTATEGWQACRQEFGCTPRVIKESALDHVGIPTVDR